MARGQFMISFGVARAVRYGLLAWLGVTYGRRFVRVWEKELNGGSTPILWTYACLVVAGIAYGVWSWRHQRHSVRTGGPAEDAA